MIKVLLAEYRMEMVEEPSMVLGGPEGGGVREIMIRVMRQRGLVAVPGASRQTDGTNSRVL